ncbi:MAG: M48 family metalloprotease, partial [Synergistaceae bacterium]|nr:M48 family metalloprotease [Synergistaceae bacterium]
TGRGIVMPLLLLFFILFGSGNYAFAEAISQKEIDKEVAAGRKVSEMIDKDFEIISDPARVVRLSSILERLTETLEINYPWQVKIIRRDELNAFCLPGGYIYFFEGLINKLRSDAEIASIMAHEIAHIVGRHAMKQSARNAKLSVASLILILATGGAAAPIIAAQMAQLAIMNSYSLEYEQEADVEGVKMLISSGYTPSGVVTAMETLLAEEIKTPLYNYGIYMSHPETRKRVEYLAKYLRDNLIPLKRKESLLALRSSILRSDDGRVILMVDEVEVWSGPNNKEVNEVFEGAKKVIDKSLQLELAPYDLAVVNGVLRIKNDAFAEEPLPEGMSPLNSVRDKLLEAVIAAQRKHPMAKYFR